MSDDTINAIVFLVNVPIGAYIAIRILNWMDRR